MSPWRKWSAKEDSAARGRYLHAAFPEVSPGLEELADEAVSRGKALHNITVHFLSPKDCRLQAEVLAGGISADRHLRQVHFYFKPLPVGQGRIHPPAGQFGLIGSSPGMLEVYRKIGLYADSDAAVVITGETGTGKELVARALHEHGVRRRYAFVAVNCSAISAELLESELFGHEKGAFTGAVRSHRGRFERANRGSIFLDEIGDMPLHAQAKLLRVLEEGRLEKVGGEQSQAVDVRVIGATNVPLEKVVREGRFRADLYHRLAVLRIHLPPLRQRVEDIPLLVEHFLALFQKKYRRKVHRLTNEAMTLLQAYLWPGNVRELRNVLERVFVETHADVIGARAFREWVSERQDFSPGDWGPATGEGWPIVPPYPARSEHLLLPDPRRLALSGPDSPADRQLSKKNTRPAELDAEEIREACRAAGGNLTAAARLLGVHRATLYRYLKKLGLSRQDLGR
jgi:sigma-54 specific flagellar transcriptional regulator A